MATLIDVTDFDRKFYRERLADFLPERLIDMHVHVWLKTFRKAASGARGTVTWPDRVAVENSAEDLLETYRLLFPGKKVLPLIFGMTLADGDDVEGGNSYISRCAADFGLHALLFSIPSWGAREFEDRMLGGGFCGAKVYLTWAHPDIPADKIQIFDFLPRHQLEVLERHGWIAMLHLPRHARLRDSENLSQILDIEDSYPDVKLIIAHVGRAYCREDIGEAFEILKPAQRLHFDLSANTNDEVFEELIRSVGSKRILFGSDLPAVRMRMRRICEKGNYVNLVPAGLYGDVSSDSHMREVSGEEAERLTFFLYEEIDAFRRAAARTGLTPEDVRDVFYENGRRMLADIW